MCDVYNVNSKICPRISVGLVVIIILLSTSIVLISLAITKQVVYAHHIIDQIPVASRPMGLSLSDDQRLLYVSNLGKPIVSTINTTSNKLIGDINTRTKTGVMAVEAIPQKLYVAPFEGGVLEVYDSNSKNLTRIIPLPNSEIVLTPPPISEQNNGGPLSLSFLTGGWSMTYDHNNGMLYVANYNANLIDIIDTRTDKAVGTISVPVHPINVKVDPDNGILLVTSLAGDGLTFISTKTNQILNTISTGAAPWGLDIDNKEKLAYVTNRGSNYVTVVDIPTQKVITNIAIGGPAQAIAVDDKEHMVYTSYMDMPRIVKIDGNTNTILTTIDLGGTTLLQDLAVDSNTHNLYASTKYEDNILVIGPKAISKTIPVIASGLPFALIAGNITGHGQDVEISEPFIDIKTKSLTMKVSSHDGGDLTLRIPRNLLDAKDTNAKDIAFKVSIDGKSVSYQEEKIKSPNTAINGAGGYREMTFFVPKDSKALEVVGTKTISLIANNVPVAGVK